MNTTEQAEHPRRRALGWTLRLGVLASVLLTAGVTGAGAFASGGGGVLAGGGGGGWCSGFTDGDEVLLLDVCLEGTAHFLTAGEDLTVVNEGLTPHDYTAVDGSFGTGQLAPGERATISDLPPGVHRVYCTLHADRNGHGMAGVLVVADGAAVLDTDDSSDATAAAVQGTDRAAGPHPITWGVAAVAVVALLVAAAALSVVVGDRRSPLQAESP